MSLQLRMHPFWFIVNDVSSEDATDKVFTKQVTIVSTKHSGARVASVASIALVRTLAGVSSVPGTGNECISVCGSIFGTLPPLVLTESKEKTLSIGHTQEKQGEKPEGHGH